MKTFLISLDWDTPAIFLMKSNKWEINTIGAIWRSYAHSKDLYSKVDEKHQSFDRQGRWKPVFNEYHDEMNKYTIKVSSLYDQKKILFIDDPDIDSINELWGKSENNIETLFKLLQK